MKKNEYLFIVVIGLFFLLNTLKAQNNTINDNKKNETTKDIQFEWKIEGQIGVFTDGNAFFLNFGGPSIRIKKNKFTFSWVTAPSLRFLEDSPRTFIIPTVGTGPEIAYKKLAIGFPFFYNNAKNEWMPTAGLAYKF